MRFYPDDLTDRWGFYDGDIMNQLILEHNIQTKLYHKDVLIHVIKEFILPKLDKEVKLYENFSSSHNCAIADTINGIPASVFTGESDGELKPEYIDVDDDVLVEFIKNIKE